MIFHIEHADDPRIEDFQDIRDRDRVGRQGLIMVEGEVLLRTLLSPAARTGPVALLLSERQHGRLANGLLEGLSGATPVYVAAQSVLDAIAGFPLHRGVLALARRPPPETIASWSASAAPIVIGVGIGNHDNIGGLFRNAAAFGAGGVALDSTCCDPFYRKAIRVSAGAALRMPYAFEGSGHEILDALVIAGFHPVALSPGGQARLHETDGTLRAAIVVGPEGPGLPSDILARCQTARIPMAGGFDSLNVATASALALEHFTRHQRA